VNIVVALHPECIVEWLGVSRGGRRTALSDMVLVMAMTNGVMLEEIEQLTTTIAGHTARTVLETLQQRRLLQWRLVGEDGAVVAVASPLAAGVGWPCFDPPRGGALSRFASVSVRSGTWIVESGASRWEVELDSSSMARLTDADPDLLAFLSPLGLLDDHDESASLVRWEALDLMFATRSSLDLAPEHIGATFRFREVMGPTPFDQTAEFPGLAVSLPVPPPLPTVALGDLIDQRRSVFNFRDQPLPVELLSSLLWHTLRVTRLMSRDPAVKDSYDFAMKPVSSSGAMSAIDAWVMARDVSGLSTGTWWYNPLTHQLHQTSGRVVDQGLASDPPATVILATRHERLAWKYERIAFNVALRDTGVLIHALQLTAAALGVGTCAQGAAANSDLAEVMGTDPLRRMPTGQLWVGLPATE